MKNEPIYVSFTKKFVIREKLSSNLWMDEGTLCTQPLNMRWIRGPPSIDKSGHTRHWELPMV